MSEAVRFRVYGVPRPQGSMRTFVRGKSVVTIHQGAEELKSWREAVRSSAPKGHLLDGPLFVRISFFMPAPKRPSSAFPMRGDIDKLVRSCLDALTGVVFLDDRQVVSLVAHRRYASEAEPPGAEVEICPL